MERRQAIQSLLCTAVAASLQLRTHAQGLSPEFSELAAIRARAHAFLQEFDAPGLSVAFARDGRLLHAQAFGCTGHDGLEPLTTSHLFRIASVSKPITSAAVFSLIESGKLSLSQKVFGKQGVLGVQYGKQPYGRGIEQISIDHLLTHTCGGWGKQEDPMFHNTEMSQSSLISWTLDNIALHNQPGTAFTYSNFGYCLSGRVIEAVTGKPYSQYVNAHVLAKAAISDMRIAANTLRDRAPNEVTYYGQKLVEGEDHFDDPYKLNVARMDSHGGWIATPTDLVNFASHIDGFAPSRNLLRPETIRTMTTSGATNTSYARGWSVNNAGHWWHGGDLGGTSAILVRTSSRFCWAALTNTRRGSSQSGLDDMMWDMARSVNAWRTALA